MKQLRSSLVSLMLHELMEMPGLITCAPVWWHGAACIHSENKSHTDVSSEKAVHIIVPTYTMRRTRPLILVSGDVTTATSPVNSPSVPPRVILAKAVCHMLWSVWVHLESQHPQPCKNKAQIGVFWPRVSMNLALLAERGCCHFTWVLGEICGYVWIH